MSSGETSPGAGAGPPTAAGPPYLPTTAGLGGTPTPKVDDPVCAVLLVFFVAAAATNMTIFQINRRRDHKFVFSAMLFGFCMARITALVMRIVWASRPHNVRIAIAGNILTLAGVVLLFLVNLLFAQRLLRAYRPRVGWHRAVTLVFRFLFVSIVACLLMLIAATVDSFYTLNPSTRLIDRKIQLVGSTWYALLAFLPLPIVLLTVYLPPRPPFHGPVEPFGHGRLATKVRLLLFTSTLLALGAGFRAGANFDARPLVRPAWFDNKPSYYCFNYVIELIVVYTYTIARFDKRFHVPNGASAPGHYAAGSGLAGMTDTTTGGGGLQRKPSLADRVNTEAEVFGAGNERDIPTNAAMEEKAKDWDAQARDELQKEDDGEAV
ncbi:hypothetical protein SPI_00587 [Niveomyces insectorum RCEF 264]|uniref:Family c-likeg-protein-coupled receptor protein n=1 Tax=Niveomyces insectorum RCEF 264 TaxID=1081102 RepID=A0A162JG06_9HYPO|nr:hypothetical protein SPI_00587 [Niveomyces insectorum RCEF 264]